MIYRGTRGDAVVDLFCDEVALHFGCVVRPSVLDVPLSDFAGGALLMAPAIVTEPRGVPATDDPFLWVALVTQNPSSNAPGTDVALVNRAETMVRLTLQRDGYKFGNLTPLPTGALPPQGGGWVPTDALFGHGGNRCILPWPVLFFATDSIMVEVANQQGALADNMLPMTMHGYKLRRVWGQS